MLIFHLLDVVLESEHLQYLLYHLLIELSHFLSRLKLGRIDAYVLKNDFKLLLEMLLLCRQHCLENLGPQVDSRASVPSPATRGLRLLSINISRYNGGFLVCGLLVGIGGGERLLRVDELAKSLFLFFLLFDLLVKLL